jgi:hypothetical protein
LALLSQYLHKELGDGNVQVESARGNIRVRKQAEIKRGETQSCEGMFVIRGSDSLSLEGGQSLVVMRRAKVRVECLTSSYQLLVRAETHLGVDLTLESILVEYSKGSPD